MKKTKSMRLKELSVAVVNNEFSAVFTEYTSSGTTRKRFASKFDRTFSLRSSSGSA